MVASDAAVDSGRTGEEAAVAEFDASQPDGGKPPCENGVVDGDETAVDCGGTCGDCADGLGCMMDADCVSGWCDDGLCKESSFCPRHPDASLCDGFEDPGLSGWFFDAANSAIVSSVTTPVYKGRRSIRGQSTEPGGRSYLSAVFDPVVDSRIYARVFVFVESTAVLGHINILDFYPKFGMASEGSIGFGFLDEKAFGWGGNGSQLISSSAVVPRDTWFCLRVAFDAKAGAKVEIFVDDQMVAMAEGVDIASEGGISKVHLPVVYTWNGVGPQVPVGIAVDELLIDTTPISCAP
ncbi:MAG: hypothetical protein KC416_06845 [Myxococcales bacterium]|nr:hypothetical protein [Myxococcales bacterium]